MAAPVVPVTTAATAADDMTGSGARFVSATRRGTVRCADEVRAGSATSGNGSGGRAALFAAIAPRPFTTAR